MRDPKRIGKVLGELRKVWDRYPDLRLGQLLDNVLAKENMFYIEDETLATKFKKFSLMGNRLGD